MQCPKLLDYIHDAQKCPSQFHLCSFKCDETLARLKIQPSSLQNAPYCRGIDFGYCGTLTFPKMCISATTIGMPSWFLYGWHKIL